MRNAVYVLLAGLLVAALSPSFAFAYVGPGAGLSAIGSLLSLLAAIGLGIVGFIWYPIRRLLRHFSGKKPGATEATK